MADSQDNSPRPIFIGGCGRSGTTMLGAMLGTHPDCLTTPEATFFYPPIRAQRSSGREPDLAAALDTIVRHWSYTTWNVEIDRDQLLRDCRSYPELMLGIVRAYGRKNGRPDPAIWVDHTPGSVKYVSLLFRMYSDAKLIHMVRDGRAAAASVIGLDWGPNSSATAARWWMSNAGRGLAAEAMYGPKRVKRVFYEQLVDEPEKTLEDVCRFVGIDYQDAMVGGSGFTVPEITSGQHALVGKAPDRARLNAWRDKLTPREVEMFESIAIELLLGLGYEPDFGWGARRLTSVEKVKLALREVYCRHVTNKRRFKKRIKRSLLSNE